MYYRRRSTKDGSELQKLDANWLWTAHKDGNERELMRNLEFLGAESLREGEEIVVYTYWATGD